MIKLCMCVKRLPGLTETQFFDHWQRQHAPLVESVRDALRIKRYTPTYLLDNPALQQAILTNRGALPYHFDGLGEVWWDSVEDMLSMRNSPEAQEASKMLREDEIRFVDLARSIVWYAEERAIF